MKIAIFTEDRYGIGFLKKVVNRLISEGYLKEKIEFAKPHTPSLIKKCHNVSKVKAVVREVDKVLIVIDKENVSEYDEDREIWKHLKGLSKADKAKIAVIATEPCIEEWICISLGLNFDKTGNNVERKPDRVLESRKKYRKQDLPNYALQLDFEKLLKESNSFKRFYYALVD